MKAFIAPLLISLSVALSANSFAQDAPAPATQTVLLPAQAGKFDVIVGKTDGNLLIQILDPQGKTLTAKPVAKRDVVSRIRFDLNELPDGVYRVVMTEGDSRQVKDIVLDTRTATFYRTVSMG